MSLGPVPPPVPPVPPPSPPATEAQLTAEAASVRRAVERGPTYSINPILIHFLIVLTVVAATVVVTLAEHGELPTSVGGLFGAALGISATNVAHKANGGP